MKESWARVIPILQAKGYNVTAVQNPLTSLADDVAATQRAIALQNGPVILVGHSWAGVVITDAGMDPKVEATTTELKASHVSMLSQPKAVAAVIMDAAAKASGAAPPGTR